MTSQLCHHCGAWNEQAGKQLVIAATGEINPSEEMWPIWYSVAYSVPGWTVLLSVAEAWMTKSRISEDLAERKAYALRDWFADEKKAKKRDPYKSWQNWCRSDRDLNLAPSDTLTADAVGNVFEGRAYGAAMLKAKGERLSGLQELALTTWQTDHPNWTPENREG